MAKQKQERVEIKCPVRTDGAIKNKELPFKMLVMAPLSGRTRPKITRPQLVTKDKERDVNALMKKIEPVLDIQIENRMADTAEKTNEQEGPPLSRVALSFKGMQDLSPAGIEQQLTEQMPDFKKKVDLLQRLRRLSSEIENKKDFEDLDRYVNDPELRDIFG